MRNTSRWSVAAVALALLALAQAAPGQATDPNQTVITVPDMHCGGCAKQIATKLYEVPGVAEVKVSLEPKLMFVHPRAQSVLSPRQLWEAVEKAKKHPTKLQGPSGTFTARPQT
ncbi:MAG: heavy-metal-associated domain-containing protein [Gemmataceae bacterium]|nr:heavy-metal-associated domain-containing protein [Gemmataceae bacterium]